MRFFSKILTIQEFLITFFENNGFIEAFPPNQSFSNHNVLSLVFQITPLGEHTLIASYETTYFDQLPLNITFPQTSLTNLNLDLITEKISKDLLSKGLYGLVTIDLLLFEGKNQREQLFWTHNIHLSLTPFNSIFSFFCCLMRDGEFDPFNKRFLLNKDQTISEDFWKKRVERSFSFVNDVKFEGLKDVELRKFFEFCKSNDICFDFEKREGSVFVLEGGLEKGRFGVIMIDEKKEGMNKILMGILNSLKKKFQKGLEKKREFGEVEYVLDKLRKGMKQI